MTQLFSEVKQMQITMATEAQRLIGISLTKIAQSRAHRGGVSLHKNLLVATVLQKARYIFMEEAYHMVHTGSYCPPPSSPAPQPAQQEFEHQSYEEDALVALTPEEAGISSSPLDPEETSFQEFLQPCDRLTEEPARDKENSPPPAYQPHASELTYLDLDRSNNILRERGQQQSMETGSTTTCLKRRRAVTEWETEEAVLSILPKRCKAESSTPVTECDDEGDDSVFLDEAALFSDCVAREVAEQEKEETNNNNNNNNNGSSAMEIDRITSLVSIFSFGNLAVNGATGDGLGKLSRSVSTPDLCSAQAKESVDALQQRPFLAMTV